MLPVEFDIEVIEEAEFGNSMKAKVLGHYTPAYPPDNAEYDHHEIMVWHSDRVGWVDCDPKDKLGQIVWDYVNDSRNPDEWLELYRMAADEQWPKEPEYSEPVTRRSIRNLDNWN